MKQVTRRPNCRNHGACGNLAAWCRSIPNGPDRTGPTRVFACTPCRDASEHGGWERIETRTPRTRRTA